MATVTRYDKPKSPYAERKDSSSITRNGGERDGTSRVSGMTKKASTRQAKDDAYWMSVNGEGMKTGYDKYKLSDDPSSEELRKQLAKGSVKAEKPLSKALQAADDAYFATSEEVNSRLKKESSPKPGEYNFKKGGAVKSKIDGCAQRGKTRGKYC